MSIEETLVATALASWTINIDRAEKLFFSLSDEQLQAEIAPGKNRLIYLFGHVIAVHDAMLPLLGIGPRRYPQLEGPFLTEADRTVADLPSTAELKRAWSDVHGLLVAAFKAFSAADWTSRHTLVSEADFAANPLRNRLAILLSRTTHVGFHLGQAALVKR